MAWDVKIKRKDNDKYWSVGKLSIAKYGPGVGMKKSKELMDYINAIGDGEYINLYLWEPYDAARDGAKSERARTQTNQAIGELDDEIPF